MIIENLDNFVNKFLKKSEDKEIEIISHYDTDGIASAAIMIKTLKKLDKKFKVIISKDLNYSLIKNQKIKLFLDVYPDKEEPEELENVFIISHHLTKKSENILNSDGGKKISTSGLTYLFCKKLDKENHNLLKLAILGMVGNLFSENIQIFSDLKNSEEIKIKKGPLIFPATRPLNRVLEYSLSPYIEGVTGNSKGSVEFLKKIGISSNKGFKKIIELDDDESRRLVSEIAMRNPRAKEEEIFGDIILIKMFGKFEDSRELSAMINSCSKQGRTDLAIKICMEISDSKKAIEELYIKYKQIIVSGLKTLSESEKIEGREFILINTREKMRVEIIGTVTTILSKSAIYPEGTNIIAMSYFEDKIKLSGRKVGKEGRSLKEVFSKTLEGISESFGGHDFAAGAIILKSQEEEFISKLKKNTELEIVKIN